MNDRGTVCFLTLSLMVKFVFEVPQETENILLQTLTRPSWTSQ